MKPRKTTDRPPRPRAAQTRPGPANPPRGSVCFSSPDASYHADRCVALRQAAARGEIQLQALCRRGYPGRPFPPKMLPEISSVGFWDALANQTWGLDWHRNEGIELTYLSRGRLDFAVDGRPFLLENGHLTVTRPWQKHRVGNPHVRVSRLHWLILDVGVRRPDQPWQWPPWLILSVADLRRLTTLLRHNEQPVWKADAAVGRCFEKAADLFASPHPLAGQTRLLLCLNELFLALLELLQQKSVVLDARLATTRRSVEMFLASLPDQLEESWTLESMAAHCGLGRSRFADYCRRITNLSPNDFLTSCRVEAAAKMLRQRPELNITEIALSCGFQSSQYFATVFHRRTGLAPRQYRQAHLNLILPARE